MGFGSAKICAPVQEGLVHSALCVFSLGEILLQTFERLEMDVERASEILCHSRALGWEEDASLVTDLCPQRESRETEDIVLTCVPRHGAGPAPCCLLTLSSMDTDIPCGGIACSWHNPLR